MEDRILKNHKIEEALCSYKNSKWKELGFDVLYPNQLLRDEVLGLLDRLCTVVYFPVENDQNHGFHISDLPINSASQEKHFVYINTAQTEEKQVFTAAHELGHIWKVYNYIFELFPELEHTEAMREAIINRFAAILLMPETTFLYFSSMEFRKYSHDDDRIRFDDMLKIIVSLMNQFFVPMKAVVWRFAELGVLGDKDVRVLLGENEEIAPKRIIDARIMEIISDCGYLRLRDPTEKRWIAGLADLLDEAEKSKVVTQAKIDHLRDLFELKPKSEQNINMEVSVSEKGLDD